MKLLILAAIILLNISPLQAKNINGKKLKDSPVLINGIEYRITDILILGRTSDLSTQGLSDGEERTWFKIKITNKTDSLFYLDLLKFNAVDAESNQLNTIYGSASHGGRTASTNLPFSTISSLKMIRSGACLPATIWFDLKGKFKKDVPFTLYWGADIKIAEIYD